MSKLDKEYAELVKRERRVAASVDNALDVIVEVVNDLHGRVSKLEGAGVADEPKKKVKPMDSLIEVVDWRVSNEDYLWLNVRITRDDGIRLVKMRIVKDYVTQSDSLVIADQHERRYDEEDEVASSPFGNV